MDVRDAMNAHVLAVSPNTTLQEAAQVMLKRDVGSVLVMEDEELHGIVTEHDCMRAIAKRTDPDTSVKDIMTQGVITIDINATLESAADKMADKKVHRLPVTQKGKVVGIITVKDVLLYESQLFDSMKELFFVSRTQQGGVQQVAG